MIFKKFGIDLSDNRKLITRQLLLVLFDVIIFSATTCLSIYVRFEFEFTDNQAIEYILHLLKLLPCTAIVMLVTFYFFGLYRSLWQFAGETEIVRICLACITSVTAQTMLQFISGQNVPRSFPFIQLLLFTASVMFVRMSYRMVRIILDKRRHKSDRVRRTMIIGAGDAGAMILRELQRSSHSQSNVVCIVDDDKSKQGRYMYGVLIVGGTDSVVEIAEKYRIDDIIFAIPTAAVQKKRDILNLCQKTGCTLKTLPGIYQLVNGEVNIQKIRNVEIEDLLARDSISVNMDEIAGYVKDRTVLVTGGGGSIGSELCRQISDHDPRHLIIFDIYENNAYAIEQELKRGKPNLNLTVLIGSVRDQKRVNDLFRDYRPDIVYHAAAHKHVPLMEKSPCESIKNNVFGTLNVAEAADRYGVDSFILISTDKAVNPTNIMGASKRLCEMIIRDFASRSDTKYACVRFGNVLGSNGSVIPLFKKQIEQGGPVTVTHRDIIRYFMTIPEAVSLVLQAGAYARDGEIFVLDMGEPVKIDDLARNMIRLSGFEPDVDIEVKYTGLRPGEKLYEELLMSAEGLEKTENDLIFIGKLEEIDSKWLENKLEDLREACETNSSYIKKLVREIVTTYTPR